MPANKIENYKIEDYKSNILKEIKDINVQKANTRIYVHIFIEGVMSNQIIIIERELHNLYREMTGYNLIALLCEVVKTHKAPEEMVLRINKAIDELVDIPFMITFCNIIKNM